MGKKSKLKALQKKVDNEASDDEEETTESGTEGCGTPVRCSTPVRCGTPVRNKTDEGSSTNISEIVEKILEKRFTTRETGLEQLIKHFQSSHDSSAALSIEGYQDTIMTQLVRVIRKPYSVKEGKLCAHLLSLLGLYMGADEEDFFKSVEKPLKQLVDGTNPELQGLRDSALSCLVMLAYVCGGVDAGYRTWSYCERILTQQNVVIGRESDSESDSDDDTSDASSSASKDKTAGDVKSGVALRASAANGWILLATLRTPDEVLQHCKGDFLPDGGSLLDPLLELLEYHDGGGQSGIEIKITAGKALAYLWEVADEVLPNADPSAAGALLCDDPHTVQQILETIKEISKDSSKRISKKDRKEQRAEFRVIEDWVLKGEAPEESLRMQGAVLDVATFKQMRVVEALKEVLGTGFHSSLRMFPVVKEVLGVEYLTSDMDGAGEDLKVNKGSSVDKSRSNCRKQDRRYREINMEFSAEDFGGDEDM